MLSSFRELSSKDLGRPIRSFIFFILFYLYLWLEVDLRLIYHGGGMIRNFPVFFCSWAFFQEFISYPGGPVEYLSAFLSQFFYISWAGAVIVTIQAWLICRCTDAFIKAIKAVRFRFIRFVPPILLLVTYTQYTYNFVTIMALLTALLFVCLYLKLRTTNHLFALVFYLILSAILYYLAAGAYLLFAVLCAVYELLFRRHWRMGLLYLLSAAVISYIGGVFVFGISVVEAFTELLPFSPKILGYETRRRMIEIIYIFYLILPLTALGFGLWRICVEKNSQEEPPLRILSWYTSAPILRWFVESCLLFVIAGAAIFFSYDKERKTLFEVDYYACHRMWPQVLAASRRYPDNYFVAHAVDRALYHTGRLAFDMFSYPQHPDVLFLTSKKYKLSRWKRFDICIDLGFMNKAEGDLSECLETFGLQPLILKRLALINMVKANFSAARIYLGALSKTLFHADWADNYLALLQTDPNLSTDSYIQHLRSLKPQQDEDNILSALSAKSGQSRIAFEYLMAWYLLNRQLDKFIRNLDRLDDFDYSEIPRHYEEAILLYMFEKKKAVDLHGYRLSPESQRRFKKFFEVYNRYREDTQTAFDKLAKDYGGSYFFYYAYKRSGIKK